MHRENESVEEIVVTVTTLKWSDVFTKVKKKVRAVIPRGIFCFGYNANNFSNNSCLLAKKNI